VTVGLFRSSTALSSALFVSLMRSLRYFPFVMFQARIAAAQVKRRWSPLRPMGISQYRLAKGISVPQRRISEITQGERSVSADTALRLGRYFGMEAQFWLNLQSRSDLLRAQAELDERLDNEVTPHAA